MFKRTLVIMLSIILMATLFTAQGTAAPEWWAPYAETVEIKAAFPEIVNAVFAEGETYDNDLWTKMWKERYNIQVVADWTSIEYDTKLNLAIASNSLPDTFQCNMVQFGQLKEAGQLADLQAAYDTYGSPSLKKMMDRNADILETAKYNGELLGMPRLNYGTETNTSFLWARKDWAEAAGIKEFKTIEDVENMMKTFKENNGAEFGIMMDKTLLSFFQMAPAFHATPRIWVDGPEGSIVFGATLPAVKVELAKFAEWYKNGYIKADFATLDNAAMLEDAFNGKVGAYGQQNWAGWQVGKDMIDNQGANTYFTAYNLPSIDGEKVMFPLEFANDGYNVVRKGYEHPEAMIKLIDNYVDVLDDAVNAGTMTIEEVLPFNTNDMHHVTGPFKVLFQHYNDIKQVVAANATGVETFATGNAYSFYNEIKKWTKEGNMVGLGRYLQMGYEGSSLNLAIGHVDNEQIIKTKVWGNRPQALLDYGTTLDDLLVEGYTQIIMGVQPVDYYDTLIESWKAAGGDEVTAAVNEMYGKK